MKALSGKGCICFPSLCLATLLLRSNDAALISEFKFSEFATLEMTGSLNFSSPFIISDLFAAWPELYGVRDRLAYAQFVDKGSWANEPLDESDISVFRRVPIKLLQTKEQRPFNLFVKPTANIVNATLHHLRVSIPEPLRNIRMMGPFLSLGSRHQDNPVHSHEAALFVQLWGSKSWVLQPPDTENDPQLGVSRVCAYVDKARERQEQVTSVGASRKKKGRKAKRYAQPTRGEIIHDLPEGSAIYVPDHWMHSTCNQDDWNVGFTFQGNIGELSPVDLAIIDRDPETIKRLLPNLSEDEARITLGTIACRLIGIGADSWRQEMLNLFWDTADSRNWHFDKDFMFLLAEDAAEQNDVPTLLSLLAASEKRGHSLKPFLSMVNAEL